MEELYRGLWPKIFHVFRLVENKAHAYRRRAKCTEPDRPVLAGMSIECAVDSKNPTEEHCATKVGNE